MPQVHLNSASEDAETLRSRLDKWFHGKGFRRLSFQKGKERVATYSMGEMITFKLTERAGHATYYKEAAGGALIVFEVAASDAVIDYDGYCPLLLFGIWEKKLQFKEGAGALSKYRHEGYGIEQQFLAFIANV